MKKVNISIVIRFIISLGLFVALFWIMRNDIPNIIEILRNSNKLFFIFALFINIPLLILLSYRLKLLTAGQNLALSLGDAIYLTFIGFFFNNFLPTAIGGDIVKAYYAAKKTGNKVASYAAVLSDRLLGFLATLFIAIIGLLSIGNALDNKRISYTVFSIFLISIGVTLFLFKKRGSEGPVLAPASSILTKIKEKLHRLYSAVNAYRNNPLFLTKAFLLSIFLQGCSIISVYFFILCVGGKISLLKLFLIIPLVWSISMLPSLNGLGVREGAFVYFLKGDIGPEKAFAISLLWLGIIILYSIVGGVLHLVQPVKVGNAVREEKIW